MDVSSYRYNGITRSNQKSVQRYATVNTSGVTSVSAKDQALGGSRGQPSEVAAKRTAFDVLSFSQHPCRPLRPGLLLDMNLKK
jgi:hypothetical protein